MVVTLCTADQAILSIGADATADQILEANTTIWINYAESDMEKAFGMLGETPELVTNYASITASYKQWLAMVCADRAAFHAINQDQDNWQLATTQSKLSVLNATWKGFLSDLTKNSSEIVSMMGL